MLSTRVLRLRLAVVIAAVAVCLVVSSYTTVDAAASTNRLEVDVPVDASVASFLETTRGRGHEKEHEHEHEHEHEDEREHEEEHEEEEHNGKGNNAAEKENANTDEEGGEDPADDEESNDPNKDNSNNGNGEEVHQESEHRHGHVTIIQNSNTLNSGTNGNGGNGFGNGNGNGDGNGDGNSGNGGAPGTCGAFSCPATHTKKKLIGAQKCPNSKECTIKCCDPKPIKCSEFFAKDGCPKLTHVTNKAANDRMCSAESTHCVNACCAPKPMDCELYHNLHGCPSGFRTNRNKFAEKCTETHKRAGSCWKKCCVHVPPGKGKCVSHGDPHYVTFDGLRYNVYRAGEVVMMRSPSTGEAIHAIQSIPPRGRGNQVGYNTGLAYKAGNDYFYAKLQTPMWNAFNLELKCNGKLIPFPKDTVRCGRLKINPIGTKPHATSHERRFWAPSPGLDIVNTKSKNGAAMRFGLHRHMRYMNLDVTLDTRIPTSGLCGNWDGNAGNDFQLPSGGRCRNENHCGAAWATKKTLFDHPPPSKQVDVKRFTPRKACGSSSKYFAAQRACSVIKKVDQPDCIVDWCLAGADRNAVIAENKEMEDGDIEEIEEEEVHEEEEEEHEEN
jgi:von Willebrand factor type D domain